MLCKSVGFPGNPPVSWQNRPLLQAPILVGEVNEAVDAVEVGDTTGELTQLISVWQLRIVSQVEDGQLMQFKQL